MTRKDLEKTVETMEAVHADTLQNSNNPHDTARQFIRSVGAETASQCVAAMVRRLTWDGRISRAAREWAEGVNLSDEWAQRVGEVYSDRIHAAHLSQIAEAMQAEIEFCEAESQPASSCYMDEIEAADTLDELDQITERAASDDTLTGEEYTEIYSAAMRKAQGWDPQNRRRTASTVGEAWEIVNSIFPGDYAEDAASTARAGYPVFRGTADRRAYVCDLGDRLEVNLPKGRSINVWIREGEAETTAATASNAEQPTTAAERIGAALGGLPMLGARVSVYVPATCGTADAADNAREVDAVASTLSAWFGGATIQPGAGCWMSDTCGLVKEDTTVVYAACTAEQLADHIAALRELCENLKREMEQEAVAMQIDGIPGASGLYFI